MITKLTELLRIILMIRKICSFGKLKVCISEFQVKSVGKPARVIIVFYIFDLQTTYFILFLMTHIFLTISWKGDSTILIIYLLVFSGFRLIDEGRLNGISIIKKYYI